MHSAMNPSDDLSAWEGVSAALISDCLDRFQTMDSGVNRVSGTGLIGTAFTMQTVVGDSATVHRGVAQAPPGAVLVIDAGGYSDRAVWGEILTLVAQSRGLAGAVIDGAVRDIESIRSAGFPLFARAIVPAGPHKGGGGRIGVTIDCGGVVVACGDLILGDIDGVAVVPADQIGATLAAARDRQQREQEWIARIRAGESSTTVLGLDA